MVARGYGSCEGGEGMNVGELIQELQKHPKDATVIGTGFILGDEVLRGVEYSPKYLCKESATASMTKNVVVLHGARE